MKETVDLFSVLVIIDENETQIKIIGDTKRISLSFPLGSGLLAKKYFKQNILTEEEIENLITEIEETIVPLAKDDEFRNRKLGVVGIDKGLFVARNLLDNEVYVSNDDIERIFVANTGRLLGRLSYMDIKPLTNEAIVSITILREITHHLYFEGAYLVDSTADIE